MFRLKLAGLISYLLLITSCTNTPKTYEVQNQPYFDIKGYFEEQALKLNAQKPLIYKVVYKGTQKEAKEIKIENWEKELSLFAESDINKPAWRNSYSSERSEDTTVYKALTDDLRTKEIKVVKKGDRVISIYIENGASNALYRSNETLFYLADSLYTITKKQKVRIIGENSYEITGKIKQAN